MTKIAFIGAGSLGFTAGLVRDILTFPLLAMPTLPSWISIPNGSTSP